MSDSIKNCYSELSTNLKSAEEYETMVCAFKMLGLLGGE